MCAEVVGVLLFPVGAAFGVIEFEFALCSGGRKQVNDCFSRFREWPVVGVLQDIGVRFSVPCAVHNLGLFRELAL